MKKRIKIGIGRLTGTAARFVDAWHRAEEGVKGEVLELLTFEDIETFLKVMTATRWALVTPTSSLVNSLSICHSLPGRALASLQLGRCCAAGVLHHGQTDRSLFPRHSTSSSASHACKRAVAVRLVCPVGG